MSEERSWLSIATDYLTETFFNIKTCTLINNSEGGN